MKNIVLLAPYFLPRRRVGVWRPFKFAIHLKEFGWKPHIVIIKAEGTLTDKEQQLLADVSVYSIPPPFDFTDKSESSRSIPDKTSSKERKGTDQLSAAAKFVDRHFPVDTWLPLFMLKQRYVKQVISNINPALIWSTGDPWSSHWLARQMAAKFQLPWIADFRDPWTLGEVNLKERSGFSSFFDRYLEKQVVKNASLLTFTAKATETLYREYYHKYNFEAATIYNSFDPALYERFDNEKELFDSSFLNVIFFGSFRSRCPAESFIEVLKKIGQYAKEEAKRIRMYSFGPLNKSDKEKAKGAGVLNQFRQLDPIPPEKALQYLKNADVLWLNTKTELKNVVSAKLWDYLATQKPVISLSSNDETAKILNETGTGIQFKTEQTEKAANVLKECLRYKKKGQETTSIPFFNPDKKRIASFNSYHSTRRLVKLFNKVV